MLISNCWSRCLVLKRNKSGLVISDGGCLRDAYKDEEAGGIIVK
jgi:hypothetical protein